MMFQQHECGSYRIYTGSIEGKMLDGYLGGVVVVQVGPLSKPREVFRDDAISCGHRWADADDALEAARMCGVNEVLKLNKERLQRTRE
jgi:hypothetical protein